MACSTTNHQCRRGKRGRRGCASPAAASRASRTSASATASSDANANPPQRPAAVLTMGRPPPRGTAPVDCSDRTDNAGGGRVPIPRSTGDRGARSPAPFNARSRQPVLRGCRLRRRTRADGPASPACLRALTCGPERAWPRASRRRRAWRRPSARRPCPSSP